MRRIAIGGQIKSHLGSKLVMNAYIIMAMRLFASASGFIFWAAAARLLPPAQVGLASGVIAATGLLAGLSQLGLGYGLVRHLPEADHPNYLVNAALTVVTADGLVLAAIFLAGLRLWSPALLPVQISAEAIASFIVLAVTTGLTQLLNWHFLARRTPVYSLIKNTLQSGLAVVFLVAFGLRQGNYLAAVHAYTLATAISLAIAVIWFLPRTEPGYSLRVIVPRTIRTSFARYSLSNFAADQFNRLASTLMPLIVVNVLGPDQAAYFFIVWSLGAGLGSLDESVASSFFAESANEPESTNAFIWKSLRLTLTISAAVAIGTVIFSRFILLIYGPNYVQNAFWPLIIVGLTLIPASPMPIYNNFLRVRNQMWTLVLFSAADIGIGTVCTYLFMMQFGLIGTVLGWFVSRFFVVGLMTVLWRRQLAQEPAAVEQRV